MRGNMILKRKGEASWITYIKKRINNNLNFLSITEGPTGSSKSYTDHSIAYQLDPEYNPKEQTVFTFGEFMTSINKFNGKIPCETPEGQTPLTKRKYKVIIFEESQTSVNKREWASKINKLFQYLISTFRHQNIIVLFNSPYSDYFDGATMKLIHATFQCQGWSKKTSKSHVKCKLLQYNGKMQKFYEHSLHVIVNGKVVKFDGCWKVSKPPVHIIEAYETLKTDFTDKLNERIEREVRQLEASAMPDEEGELRKPLTDIQEEVMKTLANIKEPNKYEIACSILDKAPASIHQSKAAAMKKGYTLEEFEDE